MSAQTSEAMRFVISVYHPGTDRASTIDFPTATDDLDMAVGLFRDLAFRTDLRGGSMSLTAVAGHPSRDDVPRMVLARHSWAES